MPQCLIHTSYLFQRVQKGLACRWDEFLVGKVGHFGNTDINRTAIE